MEYKHSKLLYILSKDQQLISVARKTAHLINNNITVSLNNLERRNRAKDVVIILDQRHWEIPFKKEDIHTKLIVITKLDSTSHTEKLFAKGANDILHTPVNYNLLTCLLKKYFGEIKIEDSGNYTYKGITVRDNNSIIYNNCKIHLTKTEMSVFRNILLCNETSKSSSNSLQVTVYRINKKCLACLGIKLIINKYNQGYTVAI